MSHQQNATHTKWYAKIQPLTLFAIEFKNEMNKRIKGFKKPIYVTRPLLPPLEKFIPYLREIWGSKRLTNIGKQHQLLEAKLINFLKVPNLTLFNNGTTALLAAIRSLNLSGKVITTPFTFPATPHALVWNKIEPIFCDIDEETLNIDPSKIEKLITPDTTGILAVHVFGIPCDIESLQTIADRYNLKIIFDAAHAFGTEVNNIGIGNFGDITMFSFHATKLFHTAEGGALTYKDKKLKPKLKMLRNFGLKNEFEVELPGLNGKMNEIQAALGLAVFKYWKDEYKKRKRIKLIYEENLKDIEGITFIQDKKSTKSSLQYFVIKINRSKFGRSRDYVLEKLKEYNVFPRKYFYPLCSNYQCYKSIKSANVQNLPVANKVVNEVLALPFYGDLKDNEVEKICNIIKSFKS